MTKLKKAAIIGVPIAIGAYLIYRQFRKPKSIGKYVPPLTPNPINPPVPPPKTIITKGCSFPLKKGVYDCKYVQRLQFALNHIPANKYNTTNNLVKYRPLVEDGDFGAKTEAVLIDFWDGVIDPEKVDDLAQLEAIESYVVLDPIKFQEEENKLLFAPEAQTTPPSNNWSWLPKL